jgi:hypothetical protein
MTGLYSQYHLKHAVRCSQDLRSSYIMIDEIQPRRVLFEI